VGRSCLEEPKRINKSSDGTKSVWVKDRVKDPKQDGGRLSQKGCGITIVSRLEFERKSNGQRMMGGVGVKWDGPGRHF